MMLGGFFLAGAVMTRKSGTLSPHGRESVQRPMALSHAAGRHLGAHHGLRADELRALWGKPSSALAGYSRGSRDQVRTLVGHVPGYAHPRS